MKAAATAMLLVLLAGNAAAQDASGIAAERKRISAERQQADAVFAAEQKACYQKFAVTGCLEEARKKHQVIVDDLRRQDTSLNDLERKQRTAERLRQLEEKEEDRRRRQEQARVKVPEQREAREARATGKVEKSAGAASSAHKRASRVREKKPAAVPDVQANRQKWDERMAEAQEHKDKIEQRNAQSKKQVKPLPVPP